MKQFPLCVVILILFSLPAAAHPGSALPGDFLSGLIHPLLGLDHLVAMIALGFWAGILGGKALWQLPLVFLSAMAFGAVLAKMNFNLPGGEVLILASALLISAFALLRLNLPNVLALALSFLFAVAHGHAHMVELPAETSPWSFGGGFLAATAILHLGGILIAYLTSRTDVRALRTTS
jgi:urease accessory protein